MITPSSTHQEDAVETVLFAPHLHFGKEK